MERWIGKTAVVTGASAGIGAAISVALANAGMVVVGLARRPGHVDALQQQVTGSGKIVSRQCDVSNTDDIASAFAWVEQNFGGVHVLVNNAGVFYAGGVTDVAKDKLSDADILSTIDINLKGTIMCARHAVTSMNNTGFRGHIVNINSIAGHYYPSAPIFNVYPATKHAVTAFTAALLSEFANYDAHIKVTSISPALVKTDMAGVSGIEGVPILQPTDIADAVCYVLATPPSVNISELTIMSVAEKKL